MSENFPNLPKKKYNLQIQNAELTANKIDSKNPLPRLIIIKLLKKTNQNS